ncbi:acetate--CoA ligase [Halovenus sp. WSH3]|uniref:acetate--CoA ligase n=1 Tax=Halovenus carboxidivorans TaxID=2692199 RepID=A0A6B0TD03_9EURY|nr:acetate--CoA ligase [Halovenus carboxidivorans]MXR51079.1 acetate--CoA ligase [Halovenus carboxidivorans]
MLGGEEFEIETEELPADRVAVPESFAEQANVTPGQLRRFTEEGVDAWEMAGDLLTWDRPYRTVFDAEACDWFPDGQLNASVNCLDRHLDERKNQRALVWEGQLGETRTDTYLELSRKVNAVAAGLRELGVEEGDVVTLHMPVIPELLVTMLACARIGAVHAVVYAGFSAEALATRMAESNSSYLVVSDGYYRRGDAVSLTNRAETVRAGLDQDVTTVVVDRLGDNHQYPLGADEHQYRRLLADHRGETVDPVPRDATDELFLIYTSGTTGEPKRVTHTTGGYLAHTAWTSHAVLDIEPSDTYLCTADLGWITGHSYIVYGPLALGTTVLLREGEADQPPRTKLWELIEKHAVDILYTSPTAIRTFMKWGEEYPEEYDLSSLRLLGTVGEPINPDVWQWLYEHVGGGECPVVDTWWQTETGGHLITTIPGVDEMQPGTAGPALPGIEATVVDETGAEVDPNTGGYLAIETPWPGMPRELSEETRWAETSGVLPDSEWAYMTGDGAVVDDEGYVTILGRVDDVINVSGRRYGTLELESVIVGVEGIAEAAVVSGYDGRDQGIYAYANPDTDAADELALREAIYQAVETQIGSFARPDRIVFTPELPKTSSGKIMRRLLSDIAHGNELGDTSALRNPEVVGEIESATQSD